MPPEDAQPSLVAIGFAVGVGVAVMFATDARFRSALLEALARGSKGAAVATGERAPLAVVDGELTSRLPYRPPGERVP